MFSRAVINALLPLGSAWSPATGDDYDLLLDGIGDNADVIHDAMDALRYLRDPARTPILSDLEKEFAVEPTAGATDAERRERLAATMFMRSEMPTYDQLQSLLDIAGFNVFVHVNSPAIDPDIYLTQNFQITAGDTFAIAGDPQAYAGQVGGELLVNGELYEQSPNYYILCGEADAQCGEADALAGQFASIDLALIEYEVPADAGYWPLIFFVGGAATRDPVTGAITDIEIAPVPIERRLEFRRIILKLKPMFSWGALIVVYV